MLTSFKTGNHEFYLSVTEIAYSKEQKNLQIVTRVFLDDFEKVLRERYSDNIRLSQENEEGQVRTSIKEYLSKKLQISTDKEKLQLNYLGKEYDADQIVMYLEIEEVEDFSQIFIKNAILFDLLDDQKNIVHVKVKNKTKSLLLVLGKEQDILTFN